MFAADLVLGCRKAGTGQGGARLCDGAVARHGNAGRHAELEYAEASGQLHSTESVLAIVRPQHVAFRQKMLGLPSKTARALATMIDPVEIQKMLTSEVREALQDLRGFGQEDVAARRRQRVKSNGVGHEWPGPPDRISPGYDAGF